MRCAPVMVIRASSTVRQGLRQLQEVPDDVDVVLIREHDGEVLYYVFRASRLRARLARARPDAAVAAVVHLGEYEPSVAGRLDSAAPVGSVVLEGQQVVGVMVDERGGVRGGGATTKTVEPPPPPMRVGTHGPAFAPEGLDLPTFEIPTRGSHPTPEAATAEQLGAEGPAAPPGLFRAYPDVTAPARVGAGDTFTLSVGFSRESSPTMRIEGPVVPIIVAVGPQPEFVIQVTGFGFTFPEGIQKALTVDRNDPESHRVEFTVLPDATEVAAPRFLEVSYEFEGVVVGRAWAQVQVVPGAPAETATLAVVGGSGVMGSVTPGEGPHLTVDIFSRGGDNVLRWRFHCPYPEIQRPGEVTTTLQDHSAQSFAVQLMRQVPNIPPGEFLAASMRGLGDQIADAMADEFWTMMEQTWKLAHDKGEQPRLQITTTEPWIPWELAWVGRERLSEPDGLLATGSDGATLGELWQIGRWTTPTRHLPSGDVPASPPATTVDATEMAVIIGNYDRTPGIAPLPNAVAEGNEIAMAYGAMPLGISDADVAALMDCTLQRDGEAFTPTVIHFAGHGRTDVANPQFTGLVLAGGYKLDPWVVRGFRAVEEQHPFVFLNACEAGVGGETLITLGGLVGAFLAEGARGFIAPLWRVDDIEAHDIAIEFYRRTLDEGQTVGEAMRGIRGRFRSGSGSATALAYVFYGNPALRLQRSAG